MKDQETDNLYTVYEDTGIHYRAKDLIDTKRVKFLDCCVRWLGFDVKGKIFLGTDTEIKILIPLTDMHCVDDFPKTNLSDYDLALTVLNDNSDAVKNIIKNVKCFTNRKEALKFPDLDFSPVPVKRTSLVQLIVLYSLVALPFFVGLICVLMKLNNKACFKPSKNAPTLKRENSYESIIYQDEQL